MPRHNSLLANNFTMIELLVVISVIAILASLLFPALNMARQTGHKIACLNNQKQLGAGLFMYRDDFNDYVMPPTVPGVNIYKCQYYWDAYIGRNYLKYQVDSWGWPTLGGWQAFLCPSDNRNIPFPYPKRSYAVPVVLLGDIYGAMAGVKANRLPKHSQTIMMGEFDIANSQFVNAFCCGSASNGEMKLSQSIEIGRPHLGSANFLFMDGHAASYRNWKSGHYDYYNVFIGTAYSGIVLDD